MSQLIHRGSGVLASRDSATLRHVASKTDAVGSFASYGGSTTGGGSFVGNIGRRSLKTSEISATEDATQTAEEGLLAGDSQAAAAAAGGGALKLSRVNLIGYLAQYFAVGLIYGGLPATTYGFLLGYLHVPSYVYSTAGTVPPARAELAISC